MKIHLHINGRETVITLHGLRKIGHRRGFECSTLKAQGSSPSHGAALNLNCVIAHKLDPATSSSIVVLLPTKKKISHIALWTRMILCASSLHVRDFGQKGLVYVDPDGKGGYLAMYRWRFLAGGVVLLRALNPSALSAITRISSACKLDGQITELRLALTRKPRKWRTVLIDL